MTGYECRTAGDVTRLSAELPLWEKSDQHSIVVGHRHEIRRSAALTVPIPFLCMTRDRPPPLHALLAPWLQSDFYNGINDDDDDDDDDDRSSTASMLGPSLSTATSVTSYDVSMHSPSPAPSVISVSNSMRENLLRQEHGRSLNNYSEVYGLPADEEEWVRLEKQYLLMSKIMGKYAPPLDEIMRDVGHGTERKRCLDLGCGNGSWIMDLARDYPNCEAVAVDLVPMQSQSMPLNLRSEVDDINLGLEHFYGDFNVVHAWLVGSGIKDYERLVDQISRVLRPGGLIDVMEWDFCIYDANMNKVALSVESLGPPWMARFINLVQSAVRSRGGDVDGIGQMETLIQNHPSFEEVQYREFWLPSMPGSPMDPSLVPSAKGILENNLEFLKSAKPLLLNSGLSPEQLELLQNNARQELIDGTALLQAKLKRVYALKRR